MQGFPETLRIFSLELLEPATIDWMSSNDSMMFLLRSASTRDSRKTRKRALLILFERARRTERDFTCLKGSKEPIEFSEKSTRTKWRHFPIASGTSWSWFPANERTSIVSGSFGAFLKRFVAKESFLRNWNKVKSGAVSSDKRFRLKSSSIWWRNQVIRERDSSLRGS